MPYQPDEHNIDLAKNIGASTVEMKKVIENTTGAIDHVNEIVGAVVDEIRDPASTSLSILKNATELMKKSRMAA